MELGPSLIVGLYSTSYPAKLLYGAVDHTGVSSLLVLRQYTGAIADLLAVCRKATPKQYGLKAFGIQAFVLEACTHGIITA